MGCSCGGLHLPLGARLDGESVWHQALRHPPRGTSPRPALFLDRDGVINEDVDYLHRPEDVALIPGAAETIRQANRRNVPVVVVTNQGGIGLGLFGWPEFAAVQARILGDLAALGAMIDGVYACPHHPRGSGPLAHPDHPARKPNPGMLLAAAEELVLDLPASWIVGDHWRDLEAGKRAGLAGGIHVETGHGASDGQRAGALALTCVDFRVVAAPSLAEAAAMVPLLAG